jgi:hypothetical protein
MATGTNPAAERALQAFHDGLICSMMDLAEKLAAIDIPAMLGEEPTP